MCLHGWDGWSATANVVLLVAEDLESIGEAEFARGDVLYEQSKTRRWSGESACCGSSAPSYQ